MESSQLADVQATGFTPKARTRYYWQVTVTDNKGNTSTSTERAYFEIGLKATTAWNKSKWINGTRTPKSGASVAVIKD